jgi:hypothetical protein
MDIVFVAHVGRDEFGLSAEGSKLCDQCLPGILLAAGHDEPVALSGEGQR